jgi:hypothetical protein
MQNVPVTVVGDVIELVGTYVDSRRRQPPARVDPYATLPPMSEERRVVTTAENEAEAELILGRLAEAGIHAVAQRAIGGPEWGASGTRYVYVAADDYERAKTLLDPS